jgi:hypothetical protein
MSSIARPQKVYDFTAHARRQPTAPPPGDRLDAQLANHADAITAVQLAVERLVQTAPTIDVQALADDIKRQAAAELEDLRRQAVNAKGVIDQARLELARIQTHADRAREAADRAEARLAAAVANAAVAPVQAPRPREPTLPTPTLYVNAGGFYAGDAAGATATSADYAQVSIEWAEHLPDTIPPNILAINAISGQHWSSRWWALRSASAFGMLSMLYCGASDVPPTQTLVGDPLTAGCLYFDTNTNTMQVWNGAAWQPFTIPQKAFTASLYYVASANQQHFPLTTADLYNNSFTLNQQDPEGIECYVNGARLTPDNNPGMLTGDFFVSVVNSSITLAQVLPAGAIVAIDVLQTASQLAPGAVAIFPITNINTPPGFQDGVRIGFPLTVKANGTSPNLAGPEELLVSIDGVLQEPGLQYAVSGDSIIFNQAPAADAYVFISWFKTPLNNP